MAYFPTPGGADPGPRPLADRVGNDGCMPGCDYRCRQHQAGRSAVTGIPSRQPWRYSAKRGCVVIVGTENETVRLILVETD